MAPTASTLYKQQSRYKGKLTREYASTGLGTIYWSSTQTLGITAGWFEVDAENTKGEELFITGITGTTTEYSGTVSIRGLRDYGADTNVPAKQYVHRVTSSIIVSDNHSWTDQMITAFLAHEQLAGAFHGFAGIGTDAARPAAAAGNTGMIYWSTDGLIMYYSNGSTWTAQSAGTQPDSTTAVKGVVKMSVAPVSAASPIAVGDNDTRLTTAGNMTDLTDGGDSTLHYHATDRARANHTGTQAFSTILESIVLGEVLASGDYIYIKSTDNKAYKATNATENGSKVMGRIVTGGSADATGTYVYLTGVFTTTGLTADTTYYLGTGGGLTTTKPAMDSSSVVPVIVGRALSTTQLLYNVQRLQRIKTTIQRITSGALPATYTIPVGFPISLVSANTGNYSGGVYTHTCDGYFNNIAGTQNTTTGTGVLIYSTYPVFTCVASVDASNNLIFTNTGTGVNTVTSVLFIYEAL